MRSGWGIAALLLAGAVSAEPVVSVFAKVSGVVISQAEYDAAVNVASRQSFYHGRVDDGRLNELRHRVAGELIDRVLLKQEAQRRGVKVDDAMVEKQVTQELGRYRADGLTPERRRHLNDMVRMQVREKLLRDALEQKVKLLPAPSEADVRDYYERHQDKFTTPQQLRLSLILLKVAPSAPVASWKAAQEEAQRLSRKLAAGGDFSELAQLHSGDSSAERGGDLGFVHQGMLAPEAQQVVDGLRVGGVSAPVTMLQGVAIFKLQERRAAVVNSFERVKARAGGLLQRERSERAWDGVLRSLRTGAQFEIYDKEIITTMIWSDVSRTKQ